MEKNKIVEVVPGRDVKYSIPDVAAAGVNILQGMAPVSSKIVQEGDLTGGIGNTDEDGDIEAEEDEDDMEIEDDGDLDV